MALYITTLFVTLLVAIISTTHAQTPRFCRGVLRGHLQGEVFVQGGTCVLQNAYVSGKIQVSAGGNLVTSGRTHILGDLDAQNAGRIEFGGRTQMTGEASIVGTRRGVIIGRRSNVAGLEIENSGATLIQGTVGELRAINSGRIIVDSGFVTNGLEMERGRGGVRLCGARVSNMQLSQGSGGVIVFGGRCRRSVLSGEIEISQLRGNVVLANANIRGAEVAVEGLFGNLFVSGGNLIALDVEEVSGRVDVVNTAITEAQFSSNTGGVRLRGNTIQKLECEGNFPIPRGSRNRISFREGDCHAVRV